MEKNREILTVQEVAAMLKMSKWSIYLKVHNRELPAHQMNKHSRLFFFKDEIQSFIEELRIRPKDEVNRIANNY